MRISRDEEFNGELVQRGMALKRTTPGMRCTRARLQSGASMSTLHPGCRACSIWTRLWAMTMSPTQDGADDKDVCGVGHGRLEK
jgi:hypothetical protein